MTRPGLDTLLDDPVSGPEFSVRTENVMRRLGYKTVRDVYDNLEFLGSPHAPKGFGAKSLKEVKEVLAHYSNDQPDLLDSPDYRRYILEDRVFTVQSLMHDVERALLRAALKGHVSADTRRDAAMKLRDAAKFIEQLPTKHGDG